MGLRRLSRDGWRVYGEVEIGKIENLRLEELR